jgi:energy-coupling factor transporter ATP-binding protein EcfA2
VEVDQQNINTHGTYEKALKQHQDKRHKHFSPRIKDALIALKAKEQRDKEHHSDDVTAWRTGGFEGPCPDRPEPAIRALFRRFQEVFPAIRLDLDPDRELFAVKRGGRYALAQLSDGERQVFGMLADIAMLAERNSLIVIDEPELNLHPSLADTLWTTLEAEFPEALFVYGTHSIQFATRASVEKLIVLAADGSNVVEISDIGELEPSAARAFLGSVPGILSAERALGVEGPDSSFDKLFYGWLLGPVSAEIVPLGGADDVRAATGRLGVWDRLAKRVRLAGVVDRDYKPEEALKGMQAPNCHVLDYHEAESYLCDPAVLEQVGTALGLTEPMPTREQLTAWIVDWARDRVLEVAAQRAFARASLRLCVSLSRKAMQHVGSADEMKLLLRGATASERLKIDEFLTEDIVERLFDGEHARLVTAVERRDLPAVLRLFPGKELLSSLAARIGCANARQVVLAARKHVDVTAHPALTQLRDRLQSLLALTS